MVRVILFDVDNTLLSFDEAVKEAMRSGFEAFGLGAYEEGMFSVFHQVNTRLWQLIEKGESDLAELQKNRWNMIFERLGISADGVAFETYFRKCLFESAIPEKGAMELLGHLRGRYSLCVASNGPYRQQVNRLKRSGMLPYFSHLFISEEIGSTKPSEKFFTACLGRLNEKAEPKIRPGEMMIIGDSLSSDMTGGLQFGMQTCFYNPTGRPIPPGVKLDYTVSSLEEIASIL